MESRTNEIDLVYWQVEGLMARTYKYGEKLSKHMQCNQFKTRWYPFMDT